MWLMLEYRSIKELARYGIKWGKVLFLFKDKKEYIKQLMLGTKDGIILWKDANDLSR